MALDPVKISHFQVSERSAFHRFEKKPAAGIQAVAVKILTMKPAAAAFSAKVIVAAKLDEGVAAVVIKKHVEAAPSKSIIKKEEVPGERAAKRVRFAEEA